MNKRYLQVLSRQYPDIEKVSEEIINLQAIINLPKGTELFLSDIHGEYSSFAHILNNGSGIIKKKIEDCFSNQITEKEISLLATIIYYPEEKLALVKKEIENLEEWYGIILYRLTRVAREVSSKYTRSKVRKAISQGFEYIIDELINIQEQGVDKERYYRQIINSIIELDRADEFIVAIADLIKRMAIDHLHVVGDIFDRGAEAKQVMDKLMNFHSVDIQWGNHDILWMGAACGSKECIANIMRILCRYDNMDTIEEDYGINIRPLATFALEIYKDDPCAKFMPKTFDNNPYLKSDEKIMAKMQKAISVIQFKLEGQLVKRNPDFNMDDRILLDKIDYEKGEITIDGKQYELNDKNFPTIDPKDPHKLSKEEKEVIYRLRDSFVNSEILQRHINFLYAKGSAYKCFNSNLMFHACVPMDENGEFSKVTLVGETLSGKAYLDHVDKLARRAYVNRLDVDGNEKYRDLMWYFWCGEHSPIFGKKKMATLERYFLTDKAVQKEPKNPYFKLIENPGTCEKIFREFGLCEENSRIINGHMPVKEKEGESPIRANGKLLVIDGGMSKSYRSQTGRAGYTLTYNSYGLVLSASEPFDSKEQAIREEKDIKYEIMVDATDTERKRVADTDIGYELQMQIDDLKLLLEAYRNGTLSEELWY